MQKDRPTVRDVHVPGASASTVSKPWTMANLPPPARNWSRTEQESCLAAGNAALESGKSEQQAIFACIRAAGKAEKLVKCSDGIIRPLSILEKERDGAMVALFVPEATAKQLAVPGGLPPEELHVTLFYLGKADEMADLEKIETAIRQVAERISPLRGRAGGKIRFDNPGQTKAAFCAVPNVPGLDRLRSKLVDALEEIGIESKSEHGFNPHITLKYVGASGRDPIKNVPSVSLSFDRLTLAVKGDRRDFPLRGTKKAATFQPPESARNNARKVLRWREEHPDEIRGMTSVGWRRARQLASGEPISLDVVRRMAQFARHRQNAEVAPEFKNEPWRDAGYVAWAGWGGTSGITWAKRISEANKMDKNTMLKINGDAVTLGDLAAAWLEKAERYTNVPWDSPESQLGANDYAKVCLIDLNPAGEEKVKRLMWFPYRSRPGAPVNLNALRNIAARLPQARGIPDAEKTKAAKTLVRLMRGGGLEPGTATLRRAGMEKAAFEFEFEIVKADAPKRVVYGVPLRPDVADSQGDKVSMEEIEAAAWDFMVKSQRYDEQHERLVPKGDVCVVESFLAPVDFELNGKEVKMGSWVLASKIFSDDLWGKIEKGQINAYSIKGRGNRTPAG